MSPLFNNRTSLNSTFGKKRAHTAYKMSSAKGKGRGDDLKQEEILQAVVIADSFNVRFGPATNKTPRVCKVVNIICVAFV